MDEYTATRALSARLADEIVAGELGTECAALFGPDWRDVRIVWQPTAADMPDSRHGLTLGYWDNLSAADGIADTLNIDVFQIAPALGYLMLAEVADGCERLRYRVYGSAIAQVTGFDMTGRWLEETPTKPSVLAFLTGSYMAVCRRRQPLYTVHFAPTGITMQLWHRLLLPFGRDGAVQRILVCMIPIPREET